MLNLTVTHYWLYGSCVFSMAKSHFLLLGRSLTCPAAELFEISWPNILNFIIRQDKNLDWHAFSGLLEVAQVQCNLPNNVTKFGAAKCLQDNMLFFSLSMFQNCRGQKKALWIKLHVWYYCSTWSWSWGGTVLK